MSYIGANDLVFNNNKVDGIFGGGFSVNSIMMKSGISPIMTLNGNNMQNGGSTGKVSDIFGGLAIPAYAYHNGGSKNNSYKDHNHGNDDSEDDIIDDDLHDKLLGLVKEHESRLTHEERKKKKTRKNKKNKRAVTRKKFGKEDSSSNENSKK